MGCCGTVAKVILVISNGVFLACGLAILGIGVWIKADPDFSNLGHAIKVGTDEPLVEIVTWTFIGIGIFVFAIAFAGLIGTIRESKIIMGFYIVCIFIVFAAEASAGIYAGVRKDYLIMKIEDEASGHLREIYSNDADSLTSQGFNYVQVKWQCCGVKDFMDYRNSTYLVNLGNKVKPKAVLSWACCHTATNVKDALSDNGLLEVTADDRELCMMESIDAVRVYDLGGRDRALNKCAADYKVFQCSTGCSQRLQDWAKQHMVILLGVGVGVGGLQLLIMFLALWFCQSLGKYQEKDEDNDTD